MAHRSLKRRGRVWTGSGALVVLLLALPVVALVAVLLLKPALETDEDAESPAPLAAAPALPPGATGPTAKAPAGGDSEPKNPPPAVNSASAPASSTATSPTSPESSAASVANSVPSPAAPPTAPPVAPSAAADSAPPTSPPPPWQAVLDATGELPSYRRLAMRTFEEAFGNAARDGLTQWFAPVADAGFRVGSVATRFGQSGTIEGLGRLRSPWPADAVLRLDLENCNHLKVHFFHAEVGATIVYYEEEGGAWAAYATTREIGKSTPLTWSLTATDDARCRRTGFRQGGPVELRYRRGELLLSRGDVALLAAPLPGSPTDAFFEGRATIHGISLTRTSDAPSIEPPRPLAIEIDRPATLAWTAAAPRLADPEKLADGALRLVGDNLPQRAACYAALPRSGLQEIILEVVDAAPGGGVFLSSTSGKPAHVLRFCRDRASGGLALKLFTGGDAWQANVGSPADRPAPLAAPHCWIRLLAGCGNLRWWMSTDGVHWAEPEPPRDRIAPEFDAIGLEIAAGAPQSRLTLRRIVLGELAGLSSLADPELVKNALALPAARSLAEWLPAVLAKQPAAIDAAAWLRASSIRTLGAGAGRELAYQLVEALLDDAAARQLPLATQLAALKDAALISLDTNDRETMRQNVLARYAPLGLHAADAAGQRAWSAVEHAYFTAPIGRWRQTPANIDRAIRWELVQDASTGRPELLDVVRRLRFFHLDRDRPLVDWAESLARRGAGIAVGEESRARESWRELLAPQLGKEAYAVLTELQAAIDGEAWDDAARLIGSLTPQSAPGIAPSAGDKSLLTSVPVAVKLALADHPPLGQALAEKVAPLAKLRLSQATAAGDAAAVELATVQFAGTPAAVEAQRWLGDRALVAGQFERAVVAYELALSQAPDDPAIGPRLRLAAAMLGRDAGAPATQPIEFGQVKMTPEEFERLVAEMRARGQKEAAQETNKIVAADPVPKPAGYQTHVRSRLDGPVGERPEEEAGRRTSQLRVPWADRQIATAIAGSTLYISNRFQVAAYDMASGDRLWQSQTPPGDMQRSQHWPCIPMRPLVVGDRVFARLLYGTNPLLVCFAAASGKINWIVESRERESLASDPLLIEGQLVILAVAQPPDQPAVLRSYFLDQETGEIVRQRDAIELRSTWTTRVCCQAAATGEGLIAALGGATVALDSSGGVRWARSQMAVPAEEDPRWILQIFQPPLVHGGRVYVTQPGVRAIDCLAIETGRRHWTAVLPEVVGLLGVSGDRLIVRTEAGVRALSAADGTVRWRYAAEGLFDSHLVDDERILLAASEPAPGKSAENRVRLIWLDAAEGRPIGSTVLGELTLSNPRLGPIVAHGGKLLAFTGGGQHDPTRDLIELTASGEADPAKPPPTAWHALAGAAAND